MATSLQPYHRSYAGPPFDRARVHDVMRVGVVTCRPETSLRDVTRIMVGYQIHSVLVGDAAADASAFEILTDLDIARAAAGDMMGMTAEDFSSPDLITVPANEALTDAAKQMAIHRCTHLLAVQPDTGHPVGVVSALGIATVIAAGGD